MLSSSASHGDFATNPNRLCWMFFPIITRLSWPFVDWSAHLIPAAGQHTPTCSSALKTNTEHKTGLAHPRSLVTLHVGSRDLSLWVSVTEIRWHLEGRPAGRSPIKTPAPLKTIWFPPRMNHTAAQIDDGKQNTLLTKTVPC